MAKDTKMSLYLNSLFVENFKCFKQRQHFDFGKLTILTGANSSGKSSVLHAILSAIQTNGFPYKLTLNGDYINLGDYKEISHRHLPTNVITIGGSFKSTVSNLEYKFSTSWKSAIPNYQPILETLLFSCEYFTLSLEKTEAYYNLNFKYEKEKDPNFKVESAASFQENMANTFFSTDLLTKEISDDERKKEIRKFKKYMETLFDRTNVTNIKISSIDNLFKEIKKIRNIRLNTTIINFIPDIFTDYSDTFNLISSFRLHPSRTYLEKSTAKIKIDKFGDGYLDQILLWEGEENDMFTELNNILKDLGLLNSLKSKRIGGGRYEIQIRPNRKGSFTHLSDVGFGISQFLPIIVADLQLPKNSTLIAAEPEIHLHPSVQSKFGDYVVNNIRDKNKNYIIETHSEYFLNKIRLAIIKGDLKEGELSVYYLENNGIAVKVHSIKFGKDGEIDNAPDSFFDTYLMDIKDIALNVVK